MSMLTILVGGTEYIRTADGQFMRVLTAQAYTPSGVRSLRRVEGFFSEISIRFGRFRRKIPLNDRLRAGISRYIAHYQGKGQLDIDCYAFANLVYGLPVHTCSELLRYWELRPLWFRPRRGQVAFLLRPSESGFRHAAIYLGNGFYISVFGAGGDLEITQMKYMFKDFDAEKAFVAWPRE
jgi:hypothetical protein